MHNKKKLKVKYFLKLRIRKRGSLHDLTFNISFIYSIPVGEYLSKKLCYTQISLYIGAGYFKKL